MSLRLAIIGAGPIGLEAALAATEAGLRVTLFERGEVAANVDDWGHVTLFSPLEMNTSQRGRGVVAAHTGSRFDKAACLTGREFREMYLLPLARIIASTATLRLNSRVIAVSRSATWKNQKIGDRSRGDDPFLIFYEMAGEERTEQFDFVLDCSGTYGTHNWLGRGGLPAIGEQASRKSIDYRLPDVLGHDRARFADKTTLVVGTGYSAATAIVSLGRLTAECPETRVIWLTRSQCPEPLAVIENDSLPLRDKLCREANALATGQGTAIDWHPGRLIERLTYDPARGRYEIVANPIDVAAGRDTAATLLVDRVVANVGYRSDRSLYEELQVHECYASGGPIKLAASLLGEMGGDCLQQATPGLETLKNPEPNFFILGAKSYGRDSRFLIRIGLEQVEQVVAAISGAKVTIGE